MISTSSSWTARTWRTGTLLRLAGAAAVTSVLASACGSESGPQPSSDATAARVVTAPASSTTTPGSTHSTQPEDAPAPSPVPSSAPDAQEPPARVGRPTTSRDVVVDLAGTQFHIRCEGSGDSTVVLVAGFGAGSEAWDPVMPELSAHTRVCRFDHPGTGSSGPPTTVQTFVSRAAALHQLLATVSEPGPYVAVGHSFGGVEAVALASAFGDEVAGLVLVDASPTTWPGALCAVADDGSSAAHTIRSLCDTWFEPAFNSELLDVFTAFTEAAAFPHLGDVPLTALTAVEREFPDGLSDGERARLTDAWDAGQQAWAELSADSTVVAVPHTGHSIQLDRPELVVDEILRVLP